MEAQKQWSRDAAQAKKAGGGAPLVLQAEQTAWLQVLYKHMLVVYVVI